MRLDLPYARLALAAILGSITTSSSVADTITVCGDGCDHVTVDAAIANQEKAFRMQVAVPDVADLSGESAAVRRKM